jgi:hypothetical protein
VRLNPETYQNEGADICLRSQATQAAQSAYAAWPSGDLAHIESPRTTTEQERPRSNRCLVTAGAVIQGEPQVVSCQWLLGVGLSHSSDEAREGPLGRVGGAKGKAEQGTRRRER